MKRPANADAASVTASAASAAASVATSATASAAASVLHFHRIAAEIANPPRMV